MKTEHNDYRNIKIRGEEWDVVLWLYPSGWASPGQPAHQEYRWHCIGSRFGGKFSLDSLEANRREPELNNLTRPILLGALQSELARTIGMSVRSFSLKLVLWAEEDAPDHTPCPYRHGTNTGYAPVQLQLLKAAV